MEANNRITCKLHEICAFADLIKEIEFYQIKIKNKNKYEWECVIQISNKRSKHIFKAHGLGKTEAKQKAAVKCMKSPEMIKYINQMNETKQKKKKQQAIDANNYIEWGKKILDREYKLYINNVDSLKLLIKNTLAIDSEGFATNGKYPAMIQIADDKTVVILDYKKYHRIIKSFLKEKTIILCGAINDLKQLKLHKNMKYIDIQPMYNNKSLKKIATILTNNTINFQKPHGNFYAKNKWEFQNIDQKHIDYAAIDVIITYKLYIKKININNNQKQKHYDSLNHIK